MSLVGSFACEAVLTLLLCVYHARLRIGYAPSVLYKCRSWNSSFSTIESRIPDLFSGIQGAFSENVA